jgi:hypothetical protein
LYNLIIFPDGYNPSQVRPELLEKYKEFDFATYNNLLTKFALDESQASIIEISLRELIILLLAVDLIGNLLVSDDAETFLSIIAERLAVTDNSWVNSFLINAQNLFADYRHRFANIPRIIDLINAIGDFEK